jgi:hypothetical protein
MTKRRVELSVFPQRRGRENRAEYGAWPFAIGDA